MEAASRGQVAQQQRAPEVGVGVPYDSGDEGAAPGTEPEVGHEHRVGHRADHERDEEPETQLGQVAVIGEEVREVPQAPGSADDETDSDGSEALDQPGSTPSTYSDSTSRSTAQQFRSLCVASVLDNLADATPVEMASSRRSCGVGDGMAVGVPVDCGPKSTRPKDQRRNRSGASAPIWPAGLNSLDQRGPTATSPRAASWRPSTRSRSLTVPSKKAPTMQAPSPAASAAR